MIVAACQGYYRLPDCRRDNGQFAKGAQVLLRDDRWREFVPSPRVAAGSRPVSPEQRQYFIRRWRQTGEDWNPAWGEKPEDEAAA